MSRSLAYVQVRSTLSLAAALLLMTAVAGCGRSGLKNLDDDDAAGVGGVDARADQLPADAGVDGPGDDRADGAVDGIGAIDAIGVVDASLDGRAIKALAVVPDTATIAVGATQNLTATVVFTDGRSADVTVIATWSSSDSTVATVAAGRVTALRAGKVVITADVNGARATATVVVIANLTLRTITLDPPAVTLLPGSSRTFVATGTYSDGSTVDISAMVTWSIDRGDVATVDGGRVTARAAGAAVLTARLGTVSARATVTVTAATVTQVTVLPPLATAPVSTRVPFTADAALSDGTHQDVTASATWTSSDHAVAVIGPDGVASALAAGKTAITAAFGGQSGTATLVVTAATLKALQLEPVDPNVGIGVSLTFTATGLYSDGSRANVSSQVTWSSSSPAVLAIDAGGHALSKTVGTSVVTAALGALTAVSTVTVSAATLRSITVSPAVVTLMVGGSAALKAFGTYSDGSMVDLTATVSWSAAPEGVVSVSNAAATAGMVTAQAVGTATVTAKSGSVSGVTKVIVSAAQLTSIAIVPASTAVPIGASVQLAARGTFSDGTTRDVTTEVVWSSVADAIATVSNAAGSSGRVTGVTVGDDIIIATAMGVTGKATVTVVGATLASIAVTPANATTTAGLRTNYRAVGTYSDGTKVDLTDQASWATANTAVATISNVAGAEGQLLARAAGTTTVTATLGSVVGSTQVTVTGRATSSLSISPIAVSTPVGVAVQYTATLIFTDGTQRNVTGQATWSSSDRGVASIDGRGRAVPIAQGTTTISVTSMGLSASTTLTVTSAIITGVQVSPVAPSIAVGTVIQFRADAIYSDGTLRDVTANASWVSSAPGVLGVSTGGRNRGQGTAVSAGKASVTATFMGVAGNTTVTVSDAVVVAISVSPAGLSLPVGMRRQFTAQAIFSDGSSLDVTGRATWTSDTPAVAGVSDGPGARGLVTAVGQGTAHIQAFYMGLGGNVAVTVTPAMLTSIQVTPFNPPLAVGTPLQFQATGLYSDGTSTALTAMATWQSSDPRVASVSNAPGSRGRATALAKGTTSISASFQGVTGSTTLTVTDATIMQIQVTPFTPTIPVGFSEQLTATAIYSDGTNRNITGLVTWTSSSPVVAAVSDAGASKGFVNAGSAGTTTVRAQYMAVSGSTLVTVSSAHLTSITISPADSSIAVGEILALTASGSFDDGSTLDITTFVTWLSSDTSVADVSNADGSRGQATGFAAGTTKITAQRSGTIGATALTVH